MVWVHNPDLNALSVYFLCANIFMQDVVREGERLEREQEYVMNNKLSKEYMKDTGKVKGRLVGFGG